MKIDFLFRRLGALKKIIPAALLLGSLSLGLAPRANAQITFDFTYDGVSTTLNFAFPTGAFHYGEVGGASYVTTAGVAGVAGLGEGAFTATTGSHVPDVHSIPNVSTPWTQDVLATSSNSNYFLKIKGGSVSVGPGYDMVNGVTITGSQMYNGISPNDMGFADNNTHSGAFVLSGSTAAWTVTNTSPVPEPSTWALLFGVLALGIAGLSRGGGRRAAVRCDPT